MTPRSSWILAGLVALCAAAAGLWLARELDHAPPELQSGTWLPRARSVGSFSLTDDRGSAFTEQRLRGAPTLVFFGFTHCPDVCPTTLVTLAEIKRAAVMPHLRVLFVSVDPARDTPAVLGRYVHAFDPGFTGLTGSEHAIGELAGRLGVAYERVELPGGDYTMDHSAALFLLDGGGRNVAIFTAPFTAPRLIADLRHLCSEGLAKEDCAP
ncbi:MAG TPA: SCO family protein [Gemmatimonadaceae bacterium]|nr:SCO family protein [Gemmatimonadaceae bacterium]